jgi:hypothetical protein
MLRPIIGLLAFTLFSPAHAAESYDNCTGTIASLPTTISTQGTWCLKTNLATAINVGAAITIATNNVTIDCNDFRVGGLSAGLTTDAVGILIDNRHNAVVRNCGIRGFLEGIRVSGTSSGALLERNRFDGNTAAGITLGGDGHAVHFNRIIDTGGRPASNRTDGILSTATNTQITDNAIIGMTVTADEGDVVAISSFGNASEVARNYIANLVPDNTGNAFGIDAGASAASSIHRNQLLSFPGVNGIAIQAAGDTNQCGNNSHMGWDSGIVGCLDAGGNFGNAGP